MAVTVSLHRLFKKGRSTLQQHEPGFQTKAQPFHFSPPSSRVLPKVKRSETRFAASPTPLTSERSPSLIDTRHPPDRNRDLAVKIRSVVLGVCPFKERGPRLSRRNRPKAYPARLQRRHTPLQWCGRACGVMSAHAAGKYLLCLVRLYLAQISAPPLQVSSVHAGADCE